nr:MAG TPA: NOTCH protein [Caudoviricetes sp.]
MPSSEKLPLPISIIYIEIDNRPVCMCSSVYII